VSDEVDLTVCYFEACWSAAKGQ